MNKLKHITKVCLFCVLTVAPVVALQSCTKSKVSASGSSVYANPDSIQFTPEHLSYMLRFTYSNFNASAPHSDLDSIENASDDDAAMTAYENAIDKFVDNGTMADGWKQYARSALGVGSDDGDEEERYPENLFAKVVLSGNPISEFILAQYAIDDDGNEVTQNYIDGPPSSAQAGYITMREFEEVYLNQFMFKMVREVINFNLCDTAPYTRITLKAWSQDEINSAYIESGGSFCFSCHTNMNPIRGAWHNFKGNFDYDATNAQNNNQYDEESNEGDGSTLEPRDPATGDPMDEATAEATMYKLTDSGVALDTPRTLAMEIAAHPRYPRCMVERFFSVFLNTDKGHPGINYVVPDHFSENAEQIAYLDEWTAKFNDLNQVPKDFFKTFLKDKSYLILGYTPAE